MESYRLTLTVWQRSGELFFTRHFPVEWHDQMGFALMPHPKTLPSDVIADLVRVTQEFMAATMSSNLVKSHHSVRIEVEVPNLGWVPFNNYPSEELINRWVKCCSKRNQWSSNPDAN
jgi:hypothetical protein